MPLGFNQVEGLSFECLKIVECEHGRLSQTAKSEPLSFCRGYCRWRSLEVCCGKTREQSTASLRSAFVGSLGDFD